MGKSIPVEEIEKICMEKGMSRSDFEEVVQKLKRSGDIFEPKAGVIQRL